MSQTHICFSAYTHTWHAPTESKGLLQILRSCCKIFFTLFFPRIILHVIGNIDLHVLRLLVLPYKRIRNRWLELNPSLATLDAKSIFVKLSTSHTPSGLDSVEFIREETTDYVCPRIFLERTLSKSNSLRTWPFASTSDLNGSGAGILY